MISLRQSIKELDEAERAHQAAAKAFGEALETSAAHVVEVNRQEAEEFRAQVLGLAGRVSQSRAATELNAARSAFREGLRDYSEKAGAQVERLRGELSAAASAMQTFVQGVSVSTGEHESVLRREFRKLESAAGREDPPAIRAAIHQTIHNITESYEGLKQAQALVMAQLRDEIRVLQEELERGKSKEASIPGTISRQALERDAEELVRQDRSFALVLAAFTDTRESPAADKVDKLSELARHRVAKAAVATWGSNLYAVIVTTDVPVEHWAKLLAAPVEVVAHRSGQAPATFFEQLSRTTATLTKRSAQL